MSSWASAISLLFATLLAGVIWPGGAVQTLSSPAHSPTASAAMMSATPTMAREAATHREDVALANQCVSDGMDKSDCLCVVKIMKHEMTLQSYRRNVRTYVGQNPDRSDTLSGLDILSDTAFAQRCETAHAFFFPKQARH